MKKRLQPINKNERAIIAQILEEYWKHYLSPKYRAAGGYDSDTSRIYNKCKFNRNDDSIYPPREE